MGHIEEAISEANKAINEFKFNKFKLVDVNEYENSVKLFNTYQPFFYDLAGLFWMWNIDNSNWVMVDEIDLMNKLDKLLQFNGQTIKSGIKYNYIEALKRCGRNNNIQPAPKEWVQFKNYNFDIKANKTHIATPNHFQCNPIPWTIGETSETPEMDKIITSWVGERYLQTAYEIIAYSCLADYPIHLIVSCVGGGRNGKSRFQALITKFIGNQNICSTELDLLIENRFETVKLHKKLVCLLGETNFGELAKTALLKKLSGGDLIGFEYKGKKPFDGYNYAKIIINTNSLPSSLDTSDGFYRRWFVLDFPNEFPEGKDILDTIPEQEYNNLAKKVTLILPELLERGRLTNQGTIEERRQKYILTSNPLPYFLDLCCTREEVDLYVAYSDLFNAYKTYLIKNKKRTVSYQEFQKGLENEGLFVRKTWKGGENGRFIEGLGLKPNWKAKISATSASCAKVSILEYRREKESNIQSQQTQLAHNKEGVLPFNILGGENVSITAQNDKISRRDILFHIERLGKGEMDIQTLKEDLDISDELIDSMKSKGDLFEIKPGRVKLL